MNEKTTDKRPRIARGTNQQPAAPDVVRSTSDEDALDEAIRRGIALFQAERLEHAFWTDADR